MSLHQTHILVVLVAVWFKKASKAYSFDDVLIACEQPRIRHPILAFLLAVVWDWDWVWLKSLSP